MLRTHASLLRTNTFFDDQDRVVDPDAAWFDREEERAAQGERDAEWEAAEYFGREVFA